MIRVIKDASELKTPIPGILSENAECYYRDYEMDPWESDFMSGEEIQISDNEYQIRFTTEIEFKDYGIDSDEITEVYTELVQLKGVSGEFKRILCGRDEWNTFYLVIRDKRTDLPIGLITIGAFMCHQSCNDGIEPEFDVTINVSAGDSGDAYVVRDINNIRVLLGKKMISEAAIIIAYNMVLALKELHVKLRIEENNREFDIVYEPTIDDFMKFVSEYLKGFKGIVKDDPVITTPVKYEEDIINLIDNIMNAVNSSEYVKWRKKHP